MPKLRKTLGSADHPTVQKLMRLIQTQSKPNLSAWAVQYVEGRDLPILIEHGADPSPFSRAIEGVRQHLEGKLSLQQLKPLLKEAAGAARGASDPIVQASARAIATAVAVIQTPTNALGFCFYSTATFAYHRAGVAASPETYEKLADEELDAIFSSLRAVAVAEETNPVKIDWNC